TDH
ncbi:peptidase M1 family protein, partial [Vibrio parahaemolyticus AQ3810]